MVYQHIDRIVVKPSTFGMIVGLLKYMIMPSILIPWQITMETGRELFWGLDIKQITFSIINVSFLYLLYLFLSHIWRLDRSNNMYLVIDSDGIYDGFYKVYINWNEVEHVHVGYDNPIVLFYWSSLYVYYREEALVSDKQVGHQLKSCRRRWRLDATNADPTAISACIERWREEARSKLSSSI